MNNCTFTGNLGRDCEVRYTAGGTAIASFSMAITSGFGERKKTTWVKCNLFGKRAEGGLVQYLKKGTQICVSGELSMSEWQKTDGSKAMTLELFVKDLDLIGGQQNSPQGQRSSKVDPQAQSAGKGVDFDDEIPF